MSHNSDWQNELTKALAGVDRTRLIDFLRLNPGIDLQSVANLLHTGVMPILLVEFAKREVAGSRQLENWLVADIISRSVREMCPKGWPAAKEPTFEMLHPLVDATSMLNDLGPEWPERFAAIRRLIANNKQIPPGWIPEDASDPFIVQAIEQCDAAVAHSRATGSSKGLLT